jgi:hypothetical protein
LYNDEATTTQMRLKSYLCPSQAGSVPIPPVMLPYSRTSTIPAPAVTAACTFGMGVVLTDADGNASNNMTDGVELWPPGSLGDLRGTLFIADGTPLRAVIEVPADATQPPAFAESDGSFVLPDLEPGLYDLRISLLGHETLFVDDVEVRAGEFTDLPTLTLVPDMERIFADGFDPQ